jgi:hypothetical protein
MIRGTSTASDWSRIHLGSSGRAILEVVKVRSIMAITQADTPDIRRPSVLQKCSVYRIITEGNFLECGGKDLPILDLERLVQEDAMLIWEVQGRPIIVPTNLLSDALRQLYQHASLVKIGRSAEVPNIPIGFYHN